jgi:hypothetical protein
MPMKSGKFAPNKSAGSCKEHKAFHVEVKPSVSPAKGEVKDIKINTMSSGGISKGPGKNAC